MGWLLFWFWLLNALVIFVFLAFALYVWPKLKPNLEHRLATEIGQRGTEALHVSLTVGSVEITIGRKGHFGFKWSWDQDQKFILPHISFALAAQIDMMKMGNPGEFLSPYLLTMEKVLVEVDLWQLIFSRFQEVEIIRLTIKDAKLVYERNLHTSNVDALLAGMGSSEDAERKPPKRQSTPPPKSEPGDWKNCSCCKRREQKKEPGTHYAIRQITVTGVSLGWATSLGEQLGVPDTELVLDDIRFNDFTQEFGQQKATFIVRMLFMSLLKSVHKNLGNMGKHALANMERLTNVIGGSIDKVAGGLGHNIHSHIAKGVHGVQDVAKGVGGTVVHGVQDVAKGVGGAMTSATGAVQKAVKDVNTTVNSTLNMTETSPDCSPKDAARDRAPPEKSKSWRCCDI